MSDKNGRYMSALHYTRKVAIGPVYTKATMVDTGPVYTRVKKL